MTAPHAHAFRQWATFHYAPIGEAPAHTSFTVLVCECGAYDVFPESNHALTTESFQLTLRFLMLRCSYTPVRLIDDARVLVAAGGTHECNEWRTAENYCAVCDRPLPL